MRIYTSHYHCYVELLRRVYSPRNPAAMPFWVSNLSTPSIPAEIRRRIVASLIRPHPAHHHRRYNIVQPPRFCPAFAPPRPTFVQVSSNPDSLESGIPLVYFRSTPSAPHRCPYDGLTVIVAGDLAVTWW